MHMIPLLMSLIAKPCGLLARMVNFGSLVANSTFCSLYTTWIGISTGALNFLISLILDQWFRLDDVTITIGEFGFLYIKGVTIIWNKDDSGLTIEEVKLKTIEWNPEKLRDFTIIFDVQRVRRELTSFKEAQSDAHVSLTLHWKAHSLGDLLSSDFYNDSDLIPAIFTMLHATDVQIASDLHIEGRGSFIALLEVAVVDGHLVPSEKVKSFSLKAKDVTFCCGPYDHKLLQARNEKILDMQVLDFHVTSYMDGPSQLTSCLQGVHINICPTKLNFSLAYVNHFLCHLPKIIEDFLAGLPIHMELKPNIEQSVELKAKSDKLKLSVCLQDGEEAICIIASVGLCFHKRTTKSQFSGSAEIQLFVPNRQQQTEDPSMIIGNELVSAPWEFSFTGSNWEGHSMLSRITSDQSVSLVLRPECVPVFHELREDYVCLLDQRQLNAVLAQLQNDTGGQLDQFSIVKEICVNCKGLTLTLEMNVYEDLLKVSVEDIKAEFNQDQHHVTIELSVQEVEMEDCTNKVMAFQRQCSRENISRPLFRSSLLQDASNEEGKIVVKGFHAAFADSIVIIQEVFLLKLLQFAGIKDKTQLRAESAEEEEQETAVSLNNNALLMSTEYFFERLEVEPFQVIATCTPAPDLVDELKNLKTALEIPAGVPPQMDKANVTIGGFFRIGISYKTLLFLGHDARRHYMKEIGRQSTSVLGSLHLLGNLSSLHGDIAEGLADLKETGDYMGFVRHVRGGLVESYNKFADSWTATIAQSTTKKTDSIPPAWDTTDTSEESSPVRKTMRGVVDSLTSFLRQSPLDATRRSGPMQLSILPDASPPSSLSTPLASRSLGPTEVEDHDSSESEESNFSCIESLDEWEVVPRDLPKRRKGKEFVRLLQLSLSEKENKYEKFVCWLKLRHENPEDKLNALVTSENVHFMRTGSPSADNVLLTVKLVNLYKARYRGEDGENYLELLMRVSGHRRLSLPSPDPADSPLVRCSTVKIAEKAASVINNTKKKKENNVARSR